jgi:simple sugar transport system permease protein
VVSVVEFLTPVELRLRGNDQQSEGTSTLGVSVVRYRVIAVFLAGALAGLPGAAPARLVSAFAGDMSAGQGWIAVVAVMLGRNSPLYAAAACVLFGFAEAIGVNRQR